MSSESWPKCGHSPSQAIPACSRAVATASRETQVGRYERFIPGNKDGILVEITARTIGARALLVPAPNPRRFNEIVVGLLGRALEISPIELCACVFVSNHYHALAVVYDQQELTRFMQHFGCNCSKEIGRLRRWSGPLWARRYDAIAVSDEPEAQWRRMKYLLSHGVKEGLVESPMQWPGVNAARALVHGEKLEGYWFNRSKECAARHYGKDYGTYDFATRYRVGFAPLPAFRDLTPEEYQDKIAELVTEIEEEGKATRDGDSVAGVEKILSQNPYEPPTRKPKSSPKPLFHTASKEAWRALREEFAAYLTQYRMASEALRRDRSIEAAAWFPAGSYPPALPFVGPPPPPCPPSPPTRRITIPESGAPERGAIPVVEIPVAVRRPGLRIHEPIPRARGEPP